MFGHLLLSSITGYCHPSQVFLPSPQCFTLQCVAMASKSLRKTQAIRYKCEQSFKACRCVSVTVHIIPDRFSCRHENLSDIMRAWSKLLYTWFYIIIVNVTFRLSFAIILWMFSSGPLSGVFHALKRIPLFMLIPLPVIFGGAPCLFFHLASIRQSLHFLSNLPFDLSLS